MKAFVVIAFLLVQGPGTLRTATGVISGQIRSTDGSLASGLRVGALAVSDSPGAEMIAGLAQTDESGRYRLEDLPAGRYYITAGSLDFPSYYPGVKKAADGVVVTLRPGATLTGLDFTLARPPGIRISGRGRGLPAGAPAGLVKVVLNPQGTPGASGPQEAPVQVDGTFEFLKVTPGRYLARLNPSPAPVSQAQLEVDDKDIVTELTMGSAIIGRVVVDDGSKLPVQMVTAAAIQAILAASSLAILPNTATSEPQALMVLRGRRTSTSQPATVGRGNTAVQVQVTPRADGYFLLPAASGEYEFAATQLPFGYAIKSVAMDPATAQIRVTLTTAPDKAPSGVSVRGQIAGPAGSAAGPRWVVLQMAGSQNAMGFVEQRIGQAPIREDGSFEITRVPPGTATIQIQSAPGAAVAAQQLNMRLEIGDRNISIVLAVTSAEAAPNRPAAPSIPTPATPFTIVIPDPAPAQP